MSPVALNPATLLPDPDLDPPPHDCQKIVAEDQGWRKDLSDQPLPMLRQHDLLMAAATSREIKQGGTAIVDGCWAVWTELLSPRMPAQKAELLDLTKSLELGADKKIIIYTEEQVCLCHHTCTWSNLQQRGLLSSNGREVKNKAEIKALLSTLLRPTKVRIIHCPGHQKGKSHTTRGNNLVDKVAKELALKDRLPVLIQQKKLNKPTSREVKERPSVGPT